MNTSKKINVNFSSLVGLKAELLRKQTEVKEAKGRTEVVYTFQRQKKNEKIFKKENIKEKSETIVDTEDINAHKKSRWMLEAKAKLYDRLKKSKNNNENFLVDFISKSDESEDEFPIEADYDDKTSDPEDAWIEYEDCFGRTRKCLRRDLSIMREKDQLVKEQVMKDKCESNNYKEADEGNLLIQEKEPDIEIMRRKWEEQTQKLADKVNIHYQDILFDEARAHGVGYYAFSQDEEERAKQQENLNKLRKETEQKQQETKHCKDLKQRIEQNRLRAARIRQRVRAGLPAEPVEDSNDESVIVANEDVLNVASLSNNIEKKEVVNQDNVNESGGNTSQDNNAKNIENKIRALGELLGKRTHWREMSQEEWIHKRRKERDDEFAPIYHNYKSAGFLTGEKYNTLGGSHCECTENTDLNKTSTDIHGTSDEADTVFHAVNVSTNLFTEQNSLNDGVSLESIPLPRRSINKDQWDITLNAEDDSALDNISLSNLPNSLELTETNITTSGCVSVANSSTTHKSNSYSAVTGIINEEKIAAGLKYLREKFEEKQNY